MIDLTDKERRILAKAMRSKSLPDLFLWIMWLSAAAYLIYCTMRSVATGQPDNVFLAILIVAICGPMHGSVLVQRRTYGLIRKLAKTGGVD